jgi:NAD(P)-dependent dehydrogenase (short-subunit alcohol dehydrogenase family)
MKNATYAAPGLSLQETYEALSSGSEQLWDDTLKTNVTSVYSTVVAFMPLLAEAAKKGQGRGSVVLTGSVAGIHWSNEVDTLAYQASKAYDAST